MRRFRSIATLPVASWPVLLMAVAAMFLAAPLRGQKAPSKAFASAKEKVAWLADNGRSINPSTRPTVITAEEWNAYANEGGIKLPAGVSAIHISTEPGVAHGDADVDFDLLIANRARSNPLLAFFMGKHHVTGTAQAAGANGVGTVHVESVRFDGIEIPRFALEYFASRFLRPKYGNAASLDSTFVMRRQLDTVVLGVNQVTITQRKPAQAVAVPAGQSPDAPRGSSVCRGSSGRRGSIEVSGML